MTAMKYWDSTSGEWVPIAGMSTGRKNLPVVGGEMTGPLRVTGNLTTTGQVHADFYSSPSGAAYFDPVIQLKNRTVSFGGSAVKGVGLPLGASDLAPRDYINMRNTGGLSQVLLTLSAAFEPAAAYGPLFAYQSADGMVSLQGVVQSKGTFTPSPISPPITTLPVEMRPGPWKLFPASGAYAAYRCEVRSDGTVALTAGPAPIQVGYQISLSDICFYPS